ncbi:thioesterase domain-containing protein [Kitasatospora sp. LaBMicrA B282]|uniref:thioesterase domain-containing protein n=1 Tax=Kitasatospora sp. LaBMicrA B282 TaxID=3420949 RepID=UPI003D0AC362
MNMVKQLSRALGATHTHTTDESDGWHRLLLTTEPGPPPVLDLLLPPAGTPLHRIAVLLPGGGLNVRANFGTAHHGRSLARFLTENGYLVLGITPREDALTPETEQHGPPCAGWGLAAHRRDAETVLTALPQALGLPYELFGHSAGAALALDLAARPTNRAQRVVVLDTTGPYDPQAEPELATRAAELATAMDERLTRGEVLVDPGLKGLFARAGADPTGDSPFPRPDRPGTVFTHLGLLHYALTHTAELPGPANWIYHRGHSSGSYAFGATAADDRFALRHTPLAVWQRVIAELGSGVQPTALLRDLAAVWGGRGEVHRIDWAAIEAPVVWVNTELGRGDHDLGARLIRAGGTPVDYRVLPGYGHGDLLWGVDAEHEVWATLL